MGLLAGKSGYAACLCDVLDAENDGPNTSYDYILLGVVDVEGGLDGLDIITHSAGGVSYSDGSGAKKKEINITKAYVDPQVQSSALAELNAITNLLESWLEAGEEPRNFLWIVNGVNKTFRDSQSNNNKYLKCKLRNLKWKPVGVNLIELSVRLEECEF
jgi:hypothetical protein